MVRLKNRDAGVPNGLSFFLPATQWRPRRNSSFQGITEALYHHLLANPHVAAQLGWKIELPFLGDRVDEWNAKVCEANGWKDYITSEAAGGRPASPFPIVAAIAAALAPRAACCGGGYRS